MAETCKDPRCQGQFTVTAIGGGVPGGKELEIIECPHCGTEQRREMTSAAFIVTAVYDQAHPKPKQ
ncbi:hypothetical protein [Bradyrhizobium sp. LMTR 3]|uniref:hypothetical protein n=1 Tax=Bradyrhizobium sp. LMTR 3 TaxID=189873 RepID=UPI0008105FDC|nr:hypothetical protein [Bradyrhizobium sp. LMTR 3]OCK56764.1 hypothetical protein LMTR3_14105 [Bradyrhizobium sp. LMTR 3]